MVLCVKFIEEHFGKSDVVKHVTVSSERWLVTTINMRERQKETFKLRAKAGF